MVNNAVKTLLSGKKYLLLQGPMGPFFHDVADWLERLGREAINVGFNAGDRFYCRKRNPLIFQSPTSDFPDWLTKTWKTYSFDTILCFGDTRPLHQAARVWAMTRGIRFLAFEEGYLRPHFITLEEGGVNAFSSLPRDPAFYRALPDRPPPQTQRRSPSASKRYVHACWYYLVSWFWRHQFPNYTHHKSFCPWHEASCQARAGWRRLWLGLRQRRIPDKLRTTLNKRYYLAILQVYNDSQVCHHSPYNDVRDYIREVIISFSDNAPDDTFLVIKHHPMDRGHRFYGPLITCLSQQYGVMNRVMYVHDLPMPELLTHSKGVVTINSTAGISALLHNKSLKVMGKALYDIDGLTFQGHLHQFWTTDFTPDMALFNRFRKYLQENTQINAVYYGDKNLFFLRVKSPLSPENISSSGI
ncbi:capsular biosynthesis protein [Yokenella regensburgei]|uniref:capsule biosynthesis protein n=1 Tax=Yokenella regensburgei TaxID=158877 RepID=UPI0027D966AA|nr:capsular biosynthesis protein [Yokenella regensburgei]MDQ4429039.1 capsular biosynthesis protein [Yokenella regensburgei]